MKLPIQSTCIMRAQLATSAWISVPSHIRQRGFVNTLHSAMLLTKQPLKGEDVGERKCSLVRRDGSVHFGLCKNVCKGKDVIKDAGGEYGGDYYCKDQAIPALPLHFPVLVAVQKKLSPTNRILRIKTVMIGGGLISSLLYNDFEDCLHNCLDVWEKCSDHCENRYPGHWWSPFGDDPKFEDCERGCDIGYNLCTELCELFPE